MDLPRGLQKPHHYAELAPVALALLGVVVAAFFAFLHIAQGSTG